MPKEILVACALLICNCAAARAQVTEETSDPWLAFGQYRQWNTARADSFGGLVDSWHRRIGLGKSQIVGDQESLYVLAGEKVGSDAEPGMGWAIVSQITALNPSNGEAKWTYERKGRSRKGQQMFGGGTATAQSTPLVIRDRLVAITFDGVVLCLDRKTGKLCWEIDLVDDYDVDPVQFGFSSSPMPSGDHEGQFVVFAGGGRGGLFRIDVQNGVIVWVSPVSTTSYATPTLARLSGVRQWLLISKNEVMGIDIGGRRLWEFPLPEQGLTNVPSPLLVDDSKIVISGQGCQGTMGLAVRENGGEWSVEELWFNSRLQYFYTNWIRLSPELALGCTDRYLAVFDLKTGKATMRSREVSDGNVLRVGEQLMVLGGKGKLCSFAYSQFNRQLAMENTMQLPEGRYWTAPSIIGNRLFIRHDDQLLCYEMDKDPRRQDLSRGGEPASPLVLDLSDASSALDRDPVVRILDAFQNDGQEVALRLYEQDRARGVLTLRHRFALAQAAREGDLARLEKMILEHARSDFPNAKIEKQ